MRKLNVRLHWSDKPRGRMHGSLRFILVTLVVLEHLGHQIGGREASFQSGIPAVVLFYLLAGYVVAQLFDRYFTGPGGLGRFYWERVLRIYPTYIFILLLTGIFVFTTGFGAPSANAWKIAGNISIIPLNYYMLSDFTILTEKRFWLIATGWSLGLELQAYGVLPLILQSQFRKWLFGLLSLLIFSLGAFQFISQDFWCYRLLPAVLFVFLSGTATYNRKTPNNDSFDRIFPEAAWTCVCVVVGCWPGT